MVLSLVALPGLVHAQLARTDTVFSVRQESIPPNDSGGRWLRSALLVTSSSAYPQHLRMSTQGLRADTNIYPLSRITLILPDSAYFLADSIHTNRSTTSSYYSPNPWKYVDSTFDVADLEFPLAAHSTIRIPILIRATTVQGPPGDTTFQFALITSYSDSASLHWVWGQNFKVRCITMYGGSYAAWQTSIPPNDSGGRWLRSGVMIRSLSPLPLQVSLTINDGSWNSRGDTLWRIADSGYYVADSIRISAQSKDGTSLNYGSHAPRTYIDTVHAAGSYFQKFAARLIFTLPSRGTLLLPIEVRATGRPGDTLGSMWSDFAHFIDSSKLLYSPSFSIRCVAACAGPFIVYDATPLTNKDQPAIFGGIQPVAFIAHRPYSTVRDATHVSFRVHGEYAEQFVYTKESDLKDGSPNGLIAFAGAPKSPIHDTLVAIYSTECWGSVTITTPIEAYSKYANGYEIHPVSQSLIAPFLGSTGGNAALVINTSTYPITLRDLHVGSYDSTDFEVSAPSLIAAHDSAYITVVLKDKDVYLDTIDQDRTAIVTGTIAPYQQSFSFMDSTFSLSVGGKINVYSPYYYSLCPQLKHGVHPAGIILTSSVKSLAGPRTFLTVYGNDDSTTEYFGVPYYDDPSLTLAIGNFDGFGSVLLPADVLPDTSTIFPPNDEIQVLTTFTGDAYHNYRTQLHWPRAQDTITIDVLVLGTEAPRYAKVATPDTHVSLSLWPDPASRAIFVNTGQDHFSYMIFDAVGRVVERGDDLPESSCLDISALPPGVYELYLPQSQRTRRFQVLR
jgi:hypothetical protein